MTAPLYVYACPEAEGLARLLFRPYRARVVLIGELRYVFVSRLDAGGLTRRSKAPQIALRGLADNT